MGLLTWPLPFHPLPGYVGTFDAPGIAVLSAFGVEQGVAAGYTLVLHAALWFPITLLGGYYMLREGIRWQGGEVVEQKQVEKWRRIDFGSIILSGHS